MYKSVLFLVTIFLLIEPAAAQPVHTVSEMRKVMMGQDLSAHLNWDTVTRLHLFGLSPLGRIQGEITILDGQIFTAVVDEEGRVRIGNDWQVKAPFGVYAQVPEWTTFQWKIKAGSEAELQSVLEKRMKKAGYDLNQAMPFRIAGLFEQVEYHIISKPVTEQEHNHDLHDLAKKHFTLRNTSGELLGFYSRKHQGIFTHRGSYVHIHFLDDARENMGHLESLLVKGKVKVRLPKLK